MLDTLKGIQKFSKDIYPGQAKLFNELGQGQKPHTMFITCSDSRIDPNLITQTKPGEIFVLRNAGNIVPSYGSSNGGEESAIEFGIDGLGVKNIVICGHSKCGAMSGLLNGLDSSVLPSTAKWLKHASKTKEAATKNNECLSGCIETNVLMQIENLKTHRAVQQKIAAGKLELYAMVYHLEKGVVTLYDKKEKKFRNISELEESPQIIKSSYSL